jgi:hypothetical protein
VSFFKTAGAAGLHGAAKALIDDHLRRLLRHKEEDEKLGFDTRREQEVLRSELAKRRHQRDRALATAPDHESE